MDWCGGVVRERLREDNLKIFAGRKRRDVVPHTAMGNTSEEENHES